MSVTHPGVTIAPSSWRRFAEQHPQLEPFLVAMAMFVVCGAIALAIPGLPG